MPLTPFVKKIFYVLFALNFILLLSNVIIGKVLKNPGSSEEVEVSSSDINTRFSKALHNFNMGDEWIKLQKGSSDVYRYDVSVPKDLPIPLLIREITGLFDSTEASFESKELKVRGTTELRIKSNNKEKLFASFNYNDKIARRSAEIGFIVSAPDLNEEMRNTLLKIPEKFLLLIIPSKENAEYVKKLRSSGKEYAVFLNDDTKDLDYKLSPSYSKERLKISVKAMLGTFGDAVCYFYDPASSLFSSAAFEYERSELLKRNIRLIDYRTIHVIEGSNYKETLKQLISGFKQDERNLIFISSEDYLNAIPEIALMWKKGYKFINPSLVLTAR